MIDCLLLLQSVESETFAWLGLYFVLRKPVSLTHVTPSTLKSILSEILSLSNLFEEVKSMTKALDETAGTVI